MSPGIPVPAPLLEPFGGEGMPALFYYALLTWPGLLVLFPERAR